MTTKSYQTTLVQDPEVLAMPMGQILHWFRPGVAVEFPPLPPPPNMPCCGSESEMINEILTEFQDSEKLLKVITFLTPDQPCMWNLTPTGIFPCPRFSISIPTNLEELVNRSAILGELSDFVWVRTFIEASAHLTPGNQSPLRYVMISLLIGHCEWSEPLTW